MENHVCLIIQISPSPPIKKTPLVGVFFIGAEGEPLEVSASRGKGRLENPPGRLAPSGARRFNISPSPPPKKTPLVGVFFYWLGRAPLEFSVWAYGKNVDLIFPLGT